MSGIELAPMAPEVNTGPPSVLSADPVKTFTTAKGSTYDAFGDGTTVRDRAERTRFGQPDGEISGPQPRSQQTIFMNNDAVMEIGGLFQNTEVPTELVVGDGTAKLVLREDVGPRKAGDDYSQTVTFSTEPEVGFQPVEIYDTTNENERNVHFGSKSTEVSTNQGPPSGLSEVSDGSVTVDNVVPFNDGTVLSDSAEYLRSIIDDGKSQLGEGTVVENDLQTTFTEVEVPSETSAEIFDKFLQTGSDNIDIFRQVLNPDTEYAATVVKDATTIADGTEFSYDSATAEELTDVRENIYDKTQEYLSNQPNEMIVYRIGETPSGEVKSFTTNPNYKATLNLPWVDGVGNLQAYTVKKSDILGTPDITSRGPIGESEVLINVDSVTSTALDTRRPDMLDVQPASSTEVSIPSTEVVVADNTEVANTSEGVTVDIEDTTPKLLTDETVNNVAAEVPVETVTNSPFVPYNTAYVPPEDDNDPVTPTFTETDDGVTVGLPVDTGGGTVAPALGVNVAGDPVMECPEGYELVDAPNGPTCVKIEDSYRLRAGAGTRPYTGQTIRPGDTGPGQRRQQYDRRTYTAATSR